MLYSWLGDHQHAHMHQTVTFHHVPCMHTIGHAVPAVLPLSLSLETSCIFRILPVSNIRWFLLFLQLGAIIVSPTRELAKQIHAVAAPFVASVPWLSSLLLVGGT
jgi:hypothetical protein